MALGGVRCRYSVDGFEPISSGVALSSFQSCSPHPALSRREREERRPGWGGAGARGALARHRGCSLPMKPVAQPSRLQVQVASRRELQLHGGTPQKLAGGDACATHHLRFKGRNRERPARGSPIVRGQGEGGRQRSHNAAEQRPRKVGRASSPRRLQVQRGIAWGVGSLPPGRIPLLKLPRLQVQIFVSSPAASTK